MYNGKHLYRKEKLPEKVIIPDKVIIAGGRIDEFSSGGGQAGWDAQKTVQIFSIEDNVWSDGKYILLDS